MSNEIVTVEESELTNEQKYQNYLNQKAPHWKEFKNLCRPITIKYDKERERFERIHNKYLEEIRQLRQDYEEAIRPFKREYYGRSFVDDLDEET